MDTGSANQSIFLRLDTVAVNKRDQQPFKRTFVNQTSGKHDYLMFSGNRKRERTLFYEKVQNLYRKYFVFYS